MSLYDKEKKATSDPAITKDKNNKIKIKINKPLSCCRLAILAVSKLNKGPECVSKVDEFMLESYHFYKEKPDFPLAIAIFKKSLTILGNGYFLSPSFLIHKALANKAGILSKLTSINLASIC